MYELSPYQTSFLDNFIAASSKLVMLQNLRSCYEAEMEAELPQETKNFRSACVLDLVRDVLEQTEIYMEYLVQVGTPPYEYTEDQCNNATRLAEDLTTYYEWATEQVLLKKARQDLVKNFNNLL